MLAASTELCHACFYNFSIHFDVVVKGCEGGEEGWRSKDNKGGPSCYCGCPLALAETINLVYFH
jgi:hypothetical protein